MVEISTNCVSDPNSVKVAGRMLIHQDLLEVAEAIRFAMNKADAVEHIPWNDLDSLEKAFYEYIATVAVNKVGAILDSYSNPATTAYVGASNAEKS